MSSQLLALAGFGFLLGMRHATDADHVIAVTTILNRSRRLLDTTLIGALWGLGHTITVLIVGTLIIVFNVVIPPPVGLAMEFAVALMLIALGILNLTGSLSWLTERMTPPAPIHAHDHLHGGASHGHLHGHGAQPGLVASLGRYQLLRPIVVGLVHGLAGSAAVALLVLATIQDTGTAIAYLADLLHRGGRRDGGPDHRHRTAVHGVGSAIRSDQSMADDRLRAALAPVRPAARL